MNKCHWMWSILLHEEVCCVECKLKLDSSSFAVSPYGDRDVGSFRVGINVCRAPSVKSGSTLTGNKSPCMSEKAHASLTAS